jgi:hypothetical protein
MTKRNEALFLMQLIDGLLSSGDREQFALVIWSNEADDQPCYVGTNGNPRCAERMLEMAAERIGNPDLPLAGAAPQGHA